MSRHQNEPRFLITGSGRSGTGYIAEVLRKCGLNVGHEQWWGLGKQTPNLDGDVSWLGCFDTGYTGKVYAQVRDPRTAIPSIAASEFRHPWSLIRAQNVRLTGDRNRDACRIWLAYTERAITRAGSAYWWRVENLDQGALHAMFGVDRAIARLALDDTPTNINHKREVPDFDWPDDVMLMEQVRSLAWILGYDRAVGA